MHCRVITTLPYTSQRLAYESSIIEKQFINCEKCIYLNLIIFQNTIFSTGYVDFEFFYRMWISTMAQPNITGFKASEVSLSTPIKCA